MQNIDPLLFSQLCVYYYTDVRPAEVNEIEEGDQIYTNCIIAANNGEVVYDKNQNLCSLQDGPVHTAKIGMDRETICVPENAILTVSGNT